MSKSASESDKSLSDEAEARRKAIENLPAPRFDTLIQLLASQAVVAMGMVPGPDGQVTKELPLARHFIDLLSILEKKTEGNLDETERKQLDGALHELRMTFMYVSKG